MENDTPPHVHSPFPWSWPLKTRVRVSPFVSCCHLLLLLAQSLFLCYINWIFIMWLIVVPFEEEWSHLIFSPEKEKSARRGCRRRVCGKDKAEGVRKWDQAMNGVAEGAWSLWTGRGGTGGGESPVYNMITSVFLPDSIDWPAPVSPQVLHLSTPLWRCIALSPTLCLSCLEEEFFFLSTFFPLTLGKKGSDYDFFFF